MAAPILIRPAEAADVEAIVARVHSAYRGEASRQGWTTEADLLDGQRTDAAGVAELLADPRGRVLVAERGGAIIGCCHLHVEQTTARFGMLAVDPALQAQGLGRRLVEAVERAAVDDFGAAHMTIRVLEGRDTLIAWYGRLGYTPTGELEPFPYGDERLGLPRRDDLRFLLMDKVLAD